MRNVPLFVAAVFVSAWASISYAGEAAKGDPAVAPKAPAVAPAEAPKAPEVAPVAAVKAPEVAPASGSAAPAKDAVKAVVAVPAAAPAVSWRTVISQFLVELVLPILGTLATAVLIPYLLKRIKLAHSAEVEALLTTLVKKAINHAESLETASGAALEKGEKSVVVDKKAAAVSFVLDRAKELGVTKLAEDYVGKLIEGQLARDAANAA